MRLIDADKLKKDLSENYVFYGFRQLLNDFYEALDSAPSIDIVRCKECKFSESVITSWSTDGKNNVVERLCKVHKWSVKDDDFCSYGERDDTRQ